MSQEWLTKELADSLFEYKDGNLYWKENRGYCKTKGKQVGSVTKAGYFESKLNGKPFKVHRVIFLMHHGYLPAQIDHIDCNRQNNRLENLRPATASENKVNQNIYKSNTSGVKGVCWVNRDKVWSAAISFNGTRKRLGHFKSLTEAEEVVLLARELLHGNFAKAA